MSKFFKALENAERESHSEGASAAPSAAPQSAASTTSAPAVERPEVESAEPPAAPRERVARRPEPVVARPEPPAPRPAAYGAPLIRDGEGSLAHRGIFREMLEPPPALEPGQLDDHLVSLLEPTSAAAEQYRTARLHIETLHRERGLKLVAVSSPARGDGKTLSAINLAGALAQSPDGRVVLIEVDVRHPGVAGFLGLAGGRGLSSYLLDPTMTVDTLIERPAGIGFSVVVAGPASAMPYELLKSPRLAALFAALRERFDYVVVDTPPVLPFPDVGILRDLVDGFLLIVRANRTPREMVRDSLNTLGSHRVLGVIFNDDERTATAVERNGAGWRGRLARPLGGTRAA